MKKSLHAHSETLLQDEKLFNANRRTVSSDLALKTRTGSKKSARKTKRRPFRIDARDRLHNKMPQFMGEAQPLTVTWALRARNDRGSRRPVRFIFRHGRNPIKFLRGINFNDVYQMTLEHRRQVSYRIKPELPEAPDFAGGCLCIFLRCDGVLFNRYVKWRRRETKALQAGSLLKLFFDDCLNGVLHFLGQRRTLSVRNKPDQ